MLPLSISATTSQDLFIEAARQTIALVIDPAEIGQTLREKMVLEAATPGDLLRDWLNALLHLAADQQILFSQARFVEWNVVPAMTSTLKAEVTGELLDPQRHSLRQDPRTVRVKEVQLQETGDGWRAELVIEKK